MMFGFVAQFCYVGAQVTCATFFINYANENGGYSTSAASRMLSYALITFTVGRFIATGLAVIFESNFLLVIYSCCAIALSAYVSAGRGSAAVGALIAIFFFMAPCYPVTRNLISPYISYANRVLLLGHLHSRNSQSRKEHTPWSRYLGNGREWRSSGKFSRRKSPFSSSQHFNLTYLLFSLPLVPPNPRRHRRFCLHSHLLRSTPRGLRRRPRILRQPLGPTRHAHFAPQRRTRRGHFDGRRCCRWSRSDGSL